MGIQTQPPHVHSATAFRRPQVAIEVAIFVVAGGRLGVVLVPSGEFSATPRWGLPAATIEEQPSLERALEDVTRPLLCEKVAKSRQVQTFDRLADPRGRLIEIAWLSVAPIDARAAATTDYTIGYWTPTDDTLELTDESGETLEMPTEQTETVLASIDRLGKLIKRDHIAFEFLTTSSPCGSCTPSTKPCSARL
jgi:hypothetical protein